jgi:two-component sensor histidine kinase
MPEPIERQAAPLANDGAWLLLAELNHRVGNELQVVVSALQLVRRELASGQPARLIEDALVRLTCFGDVHRLLDRRRHQAPLAERLEALCQAMSVAKAAPIGVHLRLGLDEVTADEETAWTLCVVAFELMTNALKHAFPGNLPGVVDVVLRRDGEGVLLTVSDNGVGVGADRRVAETVWEAPGFGSGIVAELAGRLGGFVTRVSGAGGTTATFRIPARRMQ